MTTRNKDQIIEFVKKINELWIEGATDELYNYFSNEVVFASPEFHKYFKGKDLCIRSYKEFTDQSRIIDFETAQYKVDLFDEVAIVSYKFNLSYEMDNQSYDESGFEIMAFKRFSSKWLVIWKTQMPIKQ